MTLKLKKTYNYNLLKVKIIFIINNEELVRDLTEESRRKDLDSSIKGLYEYVYKFIQEYNVILISKLDENSSEIQNVKVIDKFYELTNRLYSIIKKSQVIKAEYHVKIAQCDKATQDILHFIEFTNFNTDKKIELVDTVKKVREERRYLKNEVELLANFSRPLSYISNTLDSMFRNLNEVISDEEVMRYKKIFSTKGAREILLRLL
jgi:hypothetical protein